LAADGHQNAIYELSGKPVTQAELASALGGILDRKVPVAQVDDAAYANIMQQAAGPAGHANQRGVAHNRESLTTDVNHPGRAPGVILRRKAISSPRAEYTACLAAH
jgi:uncharacterized protein YbjT (DUF2867 family)